MSAQQRADYPERSQTARISAADCALGNLRSAQSGTRCAVALHTDMCALRPALWVVCALQCSSFRFLRRVCESALCAESASLRSAQSLRSALCAERYLRSSAYGFRGWDGGIWGGYKGGSGGGIMRGLGGFVWVVMRDFDGFRVFLRYSAQLCMGLGDGMGGFGVDKRGVWGFRGVPWGV